MTEPANGTRLTVTFTTSALEQVRVARDVIRFTWSWWLSVLVFSAVPASMAAWLILVQGSSLAGPTILLLVAAAAIPFWTYVIPWIGVTTVRRGIPNPDGPYTWAISEEGCHVTGPSGSGDLKWSGIIRVRENSAFVFLYMGRNVAQGLPKRAMSGEELSRLRAILGRAGFTI